MQLVDLSIGTQQAVISAIDTRPSQPLVVPVIDVATLKAPPIALLPRRDEVPDNDKDMDISDDEQIIGPFKITGEMVVNLEILFTQEEEVNF